MRAFAFALAATVAAVGFAPQSQAAPIDGIDGEGNLTSDVIFGSGNANGSFTGDKFGTLELALRAKKRFPEPANEFNYDGDRTYTFENNGGRTDRSVFNIEFAINTDITDADGTPALSVSDYDYKLQYDTDPTADVFFVDLSPLLELEFLGAFGFNNTPNGGGTAPTLAQDPTPEEIGAYLLEVNGLASTTNVLQGSQNLGFSSIFPLFGAPDQDGIFDFRLSAFQNEQLVGSTDISVIVGDVAPIPLPAGLPLLLAGLGGFAILRRRQRA